MKKRIVIKRMTKEEKREFREWLRKRRASYADFIDRITCPIYPIPITLEEAKAINRKRNEERGMVVEERDVYTVDVEYIKKKQAGTLTDEEKERHRKGLEEAMKWFAEHNLKLPKHLQK